MPGTELESFPSTRTAKPRFPRLALAAFAVATLLALAQQGAAVFGQDQIVWADALLLLIYLQILAMVGLCFSGRRVSLRYPLYVNVTVIARYLLMTLATPDWDNIASLGAALLVLVFALAVLWAPTGDA
jgi:protein PsiE